MKTLVVSKRTLKLMGNRFEFTVISASEEIGQKAIDMGILEVRRIEYLLTDIQKVNTFISNKK